MKEIWRDVKGYEGLYEVSDLGRVASLLRGRQILRPGKSRGHLYVSFRKKNFYVYRLVLEAFIGSCPQGHECCHFPDRNPANNRLDNLFWGTHEENLSHTVFHRTNRPGEKCNFAKLTQSQVQKVRRLYASGGWFQREIAKLFDITQGEVSRIVSGEVWGHLLK